MNFKSRNFRGVYRVEIILLSRMTRTAAAKKKQRICGRESRNEIADSDDRTTLSLGYLRQDSVNETADSDDGMFLSLI